MADDRSPIRRRMPFLLFLLFYLLFALGTHRDYGVTWDEADCYFWGEAYVQLLAGRPEAYEDALARSPNLRWYSHFYGGFVSLLNPGLDVDRSHLVNLCFALLAFWAAYELLFRVFRRPWLALLGPVLLFLTPRFTGHLPGNPRDVPFAVLFLLSLGAVYASSAGIRRAPRHPAWILGLGLLFGLTHSLRLGSYTLYPIWIVFLAQGHFRRGTLLSGREWVRFLRSNTPPIAAVLLVAHGVLYAFFPYLHRAPFSHWIELLGLSTHYYANQTCLFMGQEIPSHLLPLSYLPVWLVVTTPLSILALALSLPFLPAVRREGPLVPLLGSVAGVQAVLHVLVRPAMLDGLRVYLFLLPILVLLAAVASSRILLARRRKTWMKALLLLAVLDLGATGIGMVRIHPYEVLHFNVLTGGLKGAVGRFDTDYWGVTYKEAVEWLRANELKDRNPSKGTVKINTCGNAMSSMVYFGSGMIWTPFEDADYFICFTRWRGNEKAGGRKPLYVVSRLGAPLNYVYSLR